MGQLVRLHADSLAFPPITNALDDPPGLLAVGGDLRPERLLAAYSQGIFPWYDDSSPILWWSPDPRMVLTPARVHLSRSLRKLIRKKLYTVSMDQAFSQVIRHCADLRMDREGTWITDAMQQAYLELHQQGHAHSVEIWQDGELVGGLYGVSIGRMFFGESMFRLRPDVSKLAFVALARQLQSWSFELIDCQLPTSHLSSLGAQPISRDEFRKLLTHNATRKSRLGPWEYEPDSMNISA